MPLDRYQDDYSGCEPDDMGEYVRFEDVLEMLDKISKYPSDMTPRAAIIKAVFEEVK